MIIYFNRLQTPVFLYPNSNLDKGKFKSENIYNLELEDCTNYWN